TFGDHIEALRWHLWRAIIGFAVCLVASFFIAEPALEFIAKPARQQLLALKRRQLDAKIKEHQHQVEAAQQKGDDPFDYKERKMKCPEIAKRLGLPEDEVFTFTIQVDSKGEALDVAVIDLEDINQPTLRVFTVLEGMMIFFKVSIYLGIVLGSPWIF